MLNSPLSFPAVVSLSLSLLQTLSLCFHHRSSSDPDGLHHTVVCFCSLPLKMPRQTICDPRREKGSNIKISKKVQSWSWMIVCHENCEFPVDYVLCICISVTQLRILLLKNCFETVNRRPIGHFIDFYYNCIIIMNICFILRSCLLD